MADAKRSTIFSKAAQTPSGFRSYRLSGKFGEGQSVGGAKPKIISVKSTLRMVGLPRGAIDREAACPTTKALVNVPPNRRREIQAA
jgi:hypothetical protein